MLTTLVLSHSAFLTSTPAAKAPCSVARPFCCVSAQQPKIEHYSALASGLVLLRQMTMKLATKKSSIAMLK